MGRYDGSVSVKLQRLDHLAIYVSDLDRAESFYADLLGMERRMRLPDQVLLRLGEVSIGLMHGEALPAPEPRILEDPLRKAHHAFRVEEAEFERARSALRSADVAMSEPVDWGDHRCFYFLDPDGNLLEIVTPPSHA